MANGEREVRALPRIFRSRPVLPFGIEIDFDLRQPLNRDQQEELQRLRLEEHLLLFRNQKLSMLEQERVMAHLGPVLTDKMDRIDYISNTRPDGDLGEGVIQFHSDLSFSPAPFFAISLHAIDVEQASTSTSFASGARAYQALPSDLKERLEVCHTLHCLAIENEKRARDRDLPPYIPRSVHPAIMRHPISDQPLLYVCYQQIDKIFGMSEEESEALLAELFGYLYAPENIYEHHWRNGDLVIWDNLALQHARLQAPTGPRTLQRVTCAEKGILLLYPYLAKDYQERVDRYDKPREEWGVPARRM
jgi:taurine dioxygenase